MSNWIDKLGSFGLATAIITNKRRLSYKDLYALIQQVADIFKFLRIRPFVNIGVLCHSKLNTLLSLFSIWEVCANVIILDRKLDGDKLSSFLEDFEIGFIVSDIEISLPKINFSKKLREDLNLYITSFSEKLTWLQQQKCSLETHLISLTSGTTGTPKGVVLSSERVINNAFKVAKYTNMTQDDRGLITLPLNYCYGLSQSLAHLSVGASIYLQDKFLQPLEVFQIIQEHQITNFAAVSTFYNSIVGQLNSYYKFVNDIIQHFRFFMCAGGALSYINISKILNLFTTNVLFYNNYGQTEAAPRLSFFKYSKKIKKDCGIGSPLEGVDFRLVDKKDEACHLFYKTEDFMYGYYKDFYKKDVEWFDSGDIGEQDKSGNWHIIGRADGMIKVNGRKVYFAYLKDAIIKRFPSIAHIKFKQNNENGNEYICVKIISLTISKDQILKLKNFIKGQIPSVPIKLELVKKPRYSVNGKYIL